MSARLQGKTAIITGAASGIGEAMARLFAQHGCNLVLGDIQTEAGEALAGELGECAQFLHCDVTQARHVAAFTVTPLVAKVYFDNYTDLDATESLLAANSPLCGRPGRAEDVAQAALWLASDDAGYTSGMVLTTDAGFTVGARPELPKFAVRDAALVESQGGARAASVTDPTT